MGAESDTRPVGGFHRVGIRIAILDQRTEELVDEMRVRSTMTRALREAEMSFLAEVVNALRRELLDAFRQPLRIVGHLNLFRNLRLSELRRVEHVRLVLDEGPLEGFFR